MNFRLNYRPSLWQLCRTILLQWSNFRIKGFIAGTRQHVSLIHNFNFDLIRVVSDSVRLSVLLIRSRVYACSSSLKLRTSWYVSSVPSIKANFLLRDYFIEDWRHPSSVEEVFRGSCLREGRIVQSEILTPLTEIKDRPVGVATEILHTVYSIL